MFMKGKCETYQDISAALHTEWPMFSSIYLDVCVNIGKPHCSENINKNRIILPAKYAAGQNLTNSEPYLLQ